MVVDDEYDILHIVRRYLEKCGFSADTFTNPQFALEMFTKHPDRYSLILLDIRMPEMSGIALASMMLDVKPDARIIIMTAYETEPSDFAISLPMIKREDILKKPFTLVQVCTAVNKRLKKS